MVEIKIITGPHAGQFHRSTDNSIEPMQLLSGLLFCEWRWEIDYSHATPEEMFVWFRADLVNRIVLALMQGRYVQFMDQRWQVKDGQGLTLTLVDKIEDYIANSGFMVTIAQDDDQGLIIKTDGPQPDLSLN